jgi:hypothetical protein
MPMSDVLTPGRLEDQPFPALAGRIFREGRTGGLTIESGARRRTVWFLGGNPVAVVSEDPGDHLARFLLEHGRISEDEYARLAALPETRDGIARADFLPKEALNWIVKFRFVNLCYELFRWEEGDYSFAEGSPPRELFLLKVPAHALVIKGVGHLGRARLIDLAPDGALIAAGEISPEQARYLGPAEHRLLEACVPGSTVAAVLATAADDPEQTRALVYALACLGLVSLSPSPAFRAPEEDDAAFALEEPAGAAADAYSLPESADRDDSGFRPPLDAVTGSTTAGELEAALDAAAGSGRFRPDEAPSSGRLGSFDESFSSESIEQAATPLRKVVTARARETARAPRGSRLPRLAGIALGAVAACAIVGIAAWWWVGGEEPPAPVPTPVRRTAPPTPAPVPPPVAPSPAPPTPPLAPPVATSPIPTAPSVPQQRPVLTDRYRNGLDVFRAGDIDGAAAIWEDLLALEHRDAFTLLLLTACQQDTILDIQKALSSRRLFLVPRQVKGRNCFRVCVDTFSSRDAAARALAGLPAEFRAAGAAVRPVADVVTKR